MTRAEVLQWLKRELVLQLQQSSADEKNPLILSSMNVGGLQAHFTISSSTDITFKWPPSTVQTAHWMSAPTLPHAALLSTQIPGSQKANSGHFFVCLSGNQLIKGT